MAAMLIPTFSLLILAPAGLLCVVLLVQPEQRMTDVKRVTWSASVTCTERGDGSIHCFCAHEERR